MQSTRINFKSHEYLRSHYEAIKIIDCFKKLTTDLQVTILITGSYGTILRYVYTPDITTSPIDREIFLGFSTPFPPKQYLYHVLRKEFVDRIFKENKDAKVTISYEIAGKYHDVYSEQLSVIL
jgi:hypothetical protein